MSETEPGGESWRDRPWEADQKAAAEKDQPTGWRRWQGAIWVFGTIGVVASCSILVSGGEDDDRRSSFSAPIAADDTARDAAVGNAAFLVTVQQSGLVDDVSDSTLLDAGRSVCTALDRGADPFDLVLASVDTAPEAGPMIIGAAAGSLCREHMTAVQGLIDSLR